MSQNTSQVLVIFLESTLRCSDKPKSSETYEPQVVDNEGIPIIPKSTIIGAYKNRYENLTDNSQELLAFKELDGHVSDGEILLMPIRTNEGLVAWVSTKAKLQKLFTAWGEEALVQNIPEPGDGAALCAENVSFSKDGVCLLEEFVFHLQTSSEVARVLEILANKLLPEDITWLKNKFAGDVLVVNEMTFSTLAREIIEMREVVSLTEEGDGLSERPATVKEYIPSDTVFTANVAVNEELAVVLAKITHLQIGAELSTGHGLCRTYLV